MTGRVLARLRNSAGPLSMLPLLLWLAMLKTRNEAAALLSVACLGGGVAGVDDAIVAVAEISAPALPSLLLLLQMLLQALTKQATTRVYGEQGLKQKAGFSRLQQRQRRLECGRRSEGVT